MTKSVLVAVLVGLLVGMTETGFGYTHDPIGRGETMEPYPVLTDGAKLKFSQVDLPYMGHRCSVYFKPGHPTMMTGTGITPEKMFVRKNGILIENGELVGISKHAVNVAWYFSPFGAHGGPIPDTDIDYIIVEKK